MLGDAQPGVFAHGSFGHWHSGAELNRLCLRLCLRARCHLHNQRG
jgi:hypothetical protein